MAKCTISYTGWDWCDIFWVTSPTGKTVKVCGLKWGALKPEADALFAKLRAPYQTEAPVPWNTDVPMELTPAEMRLFLTARQYPKSLELSEEEWTAKWNAQKGGA